MLDLGIYIIIAALVGAKLLLLIVDFDQSRRARSDLLTLARSGGVFYGGLILAVGRGVLVHRPSPHAALDHLRRVCAGHRARARHRPARLPGRWLLLRQADRRAVGGRVHQPAGRGQRRDAARHPAASDADLRGRRRAAHPRACCCHRTARPPFPGRTFWATCSCMPSRATSSRSTAAIRAAWCFLDISTSQFISLVLAPLSLVMLFWLSRATPTAPQESRHAPTRGRLKCQ